MNKLGFCARCWNYVDFCDCINYEYDLEFENDKVIPPPPEDKEPEVGTVWYFMSPIAGLSLGLEAAKADKVGLGLLLSMENLWTLNPPPGDPALYLSVPVDRLQLNQSMDTMTSGTYNKYLQPWEQNYTNFNPTIFDKIKTLSQDVQSCKRKFANKICKGIKFFQNFVQEIKGEEIALPVGLIDELSQINEYVDPAVLIAILLSYFPSELIEELNDATLTAIDYDWVHRHLMDTLDPDLGYEEKQQPYKESLKQGDWAGGDGSYFFPSPSGSIAAGTTHVVSMYSSQKGKNANERIGPDRQMSRPRTWMTCSAGVCKPAKNQNRDKYGKPLPDPRPKPIFDDVIPYDSDDDDLPVKKPPPVLPNPTDSEASNRTAIPAELFNQPTVRYPLLFQVLTKPGSDQTVWLNSPCCEVLVVSPTVVETRFISQTLTTFTDFIVVGGTGGVNPAAFQLTYLFTRESGTDNQITVNTGGGDFTFNASSGVISMNLTFVPLPLGTRHFCYSNIKMRGVNGTNTIWRVTQPTGRVMNTGQDTVFQPMNTVKLTPAAGLPFTTEGYLNQTQIVNGTIYEGKEIRTFPPYQIPIMLQVRNEINMISYAPNTFVTPGTPGYCVGRSGGVGGIGTPYLPFDPIGVNSIITYKLSIEKSQGQSFVTGLLSYV